MPFSHISQTDVIHEMLNNSVWERGVNKKLLKVLMPAVPLPWLCQEWVLPFKASDSLLAQGISRNIIWELGPGMGASQLCLVVYPIVAELVFKLQDKILFTLLSCLPEQKESHFSCCELHCLELGKGSCKHSPRSPVCASLGHMLP